MAAPEDDLARVLAGGIDALGLTVAAPAQRSLLDYLELLARWNRAYNLTAIEDPLAQVQRHLLDALSVMPWVCGEKVLDVGSGAGIPGLVLAIARPSLSMTLLEPSAKRTRFLTQAVHELGVVGAQVLRTRLESLPPDPCFDVVMSRATMDVPRLALAAKPLLRPGGTVLAMLGRRAEGLAASLDPEWEVRQEPVQVPGLDAERHVALVRPRATGTGAT